ncbi:MAG: hypothetical protein EXR71_19815 [Myxococcales bacterium]|nr:hypothetical protein [Myxococcales bacterium]
MSWFDRQRGHVEPRDAFDALSLAYGRSGLDAALLDLCGSPGLRRFVVRFEESRRGFRVTAVDSEPVKGGGGPPPPQAASLAIPHVEAAITALRKALPAPFRFERGAIGVVLDREGSGKPAPLDVTLRLDEDSDSFRLSDLRAPAGQGVPVEQPDYIATLHAWSDAVNRVRGGWKMCRGSSTFAIDGSRLLIETPAAEGEPVWSERLVVTVLGTWEARNGTFRWLVERPVSSEAPFVEAELILTLGQVSELVALAAAHVGAIGVFQGDTEPEKGPALTVFAAIR